jgi:CRP/FNR family transcriptional regulator, cyclic AMP receptor protein
MKTSLSRQHEEAFAILRSGLGRLNLPVDLVDELIERHIAVAFEKGALAFCEGNTDGMLACILSGYVNVYCPVGDGNRTLVRMAGPGEIIGYPDYVDEKGRHARMFEAQVASKCTLALFSRDHIARLLAGLPPEAMITVIASLNTFWSENLRRFATLLNLPFWDRLTIVMSDLAKRAGVRDSEGIILIPEIGHEDLAEMIGCSRPMVSRLIAEMVESGLLSRRGKQYVLLKKWDFSDNHRNSQKSVQVQRLAAVAAPARPTSFAAPSRSSNGSGSRGVTSYAARSSG